uniref:Protein kinase domain-containing protein n=1 Tax=Pristionchus pacificus TaxID=54126 RepID=A0A8R1YED3_PRIPA
MIHNFIFPTLSHLSSLIIQFSDQIFSEYGNAFISILLLSSLFDSSFSTHSLSLSGDSVVAPCRMPQSSTDSSADRPEFDCGLYFFDYKIIRKLGSGGYGSVYEVEKDGGSYALKAEIVNKKNSGSLRAEAVTLRRAQSSDHVCRLYLSAQCLSGEYKINLMVMSLLTYPLNKLRRACPEQRFTRSTALRLAIQSVQAIEDVHSIGYLHRDIKAGNFAMSPDRRVVLIDFGFAREYVVYDAEKKSCRLRGQRKYAHFVGTTRYCSKKVHERKEQSRRDDLWGWLYMIVEMITGSLPWSELDDKKIGEMKMSIGSQLYDSCPKELYHIHDHLDSLRFFSKPNYELIKRYLKKACDRCEVKESDPFDWEKGGRYDDICEKIEKDRKREAEKAEIEKKKKEEKMMQEKKKNTEKWVDKKEYSLEE